ncbi:MAG: SDR family NAD(P)-dependent oxidoreductase [Chloroflexi bacterium]|nr:SDR family NAD(P)-dependent oxidoreductase [Chloroflexota bacterium]
MPEFEGKVAIVTGAGRLRGIGRGAAIAFAKLGADLVVTGTGRNPARYPDDEKAVGWRDIESTAEQVRALGTRALPLVVDVSSEDQVKGMMARTLEEFGRVDFLVNNAAFARGPDRVPVFDLDADILQKVLDVKINGGVFCSREAAKAMIEQGEGGGIVFVSSGAGKHGGANALAYNAACFAQVGMTQSLAQELGPHGINVNCVCPGAVDTSRVDDIGRGEKWKNMEAQIPIRRAGTDEEVGGVIAYLCTEAASWIHGQSINLNGGTMMAP